MKIVSLWLQSVNRNMICFLPNAEDKSPIGSKNYVPSKAGSGGSGRKLHTAKKRIRLPGIVPKGGSVPNKISSHLILPLGHSGQDPVHHLIGVVVGIS